MAALTFPLNCFVGLAVAGVEVTVAGYVRQPATIVVCADGVTYANTASQQWQHATQSWGTIDTVQLWDAPSGGNLLASLPPQTPVLFNQYDIARIPACGLSMTWAKANRPFGTGKFGTFSYGRTATLVAGGWVPIAFGTGLYGVGLYGGYAIGVLLERAFDQQTHICEPGTWAPGPFSLAA